MNMYCKLALDFFLVKVGALSVNLRFQSVTVCLALRKHSGYETCAITMHIEVVNSCAESKIAPSQCSPVCMT